MKRPMPPRMDAAFTKLADAFAGFDAAVAQTGTNATAPAEPECRMRADASGNGATKELGQGVGLGKAANRASEAVLQKRRQAVADFLKDGSTEGLAELRKIEAAEAAAAAALEVARRGIAELARPEAGGPKAAAEALGVNRKTLQGFLNGNLNGYPHTVMAAWAAYQSRKGAAE